jgi:hypothetical protein
MKNLVKLLEARLAEREKWIKDDNWINPHSPQETNGYNRSVLEEIAFLKGVLGRP